MKTSEVFTRETRDSLDDRGGFSCGNALFLNVTVKLIHASGFDEPQVPGARRDANLMCVKSGAERAPGRHPLRGFYGGHDVIGTVMGSAAGNSLLELECIRLGEPIPDVRSALERAADLLRQAHGLRASVTLQRLWAREQRKSTAIGWGAAIPHADVRGLARPRAVFLRAASPIALEAPDGAPVSTLLVLVVPRPALASHFELLSYYRRLLTNPDFRGHLDGCDDAGAVWRLFDHYSWGARSLAAA